MNTMTGMLEDPNPRLPVYPRRSPDGLLWESVVDDIETLVKVEEAMAEGVRLNLSREEKEAVFRIGAGASNLYFLFAEASGLIKIGKTSEPAKRLANLRTMSPVPLRCLGVVRSHDLHEFLLHKALAEHRSHGEWFKATPELLDLIEDALERGIRAVHEFIKGRLAKPETIG